MEKGEEERQGELEKREVKKIKKGETAKWRRKE